MNRKKQYTIQSLIEEWDTNLCFKHVGNTTRIVSQCLSHLPFIIYVDIGFNVGKVYDTLNLYLPNTCIEVHGFEAQQELFNYCQEKYKDDPCAMVYHRAVSDEEGLIGFNTENFQNTIKQKFLSSDDINLGGSKISSKNKSVDVNCIKISDFLKTGINKEEVNFIKIDTETRDAEILKDLLTVVDELDQLLIIESEINYYCDSISNAESLKDTLKQYQEKGFILYTNFLNKNIFDNSSRGDLFLMKPEIEATYLKSI